MGVEADRVDVEERNGGGGRVVGEFGEDLRSNGSGRNDERIRSQRVWVQQP